MTPGIDLQLQVVKKALTDVVAPAVDPQQKLAVEQLGLSIATLSMVLERLPLSRKLVRKELAIAIDMAESVKPFAPDDILSESLEQGRSILADVDAENIHIQAVKSKLLGKISSLAETEKNEESRLQIARAIVRQSKAQADLFRRWCEASGFDHDLSSVSALSDTLKI